MANEYDIIIRAQDKTGRAFNSIESKMNRINSAAGGRSGFPAIALGLGGIATAAVAAGAGVAAFASAMTKASVSLQQMQNRLALTTNSTAELNSQMGRLRTLARENRTGFEDTVALYSNLKIATEDLGFETEKVENLTTKLSQALAVAGADAATTSSVIRQFGQAMASGTVRGDEFNSLVEGLGPALSIMARESGITVGELREMSQAGELTAETMADMLLNSNALSESFEKMEETLPQTMQRFSDNVDLLLGNLDKTLGVTNRLQQAVQALNDDMEYFIPQNVPSDVADLIARQEELTSTIARAQEELDGFGIISQKTGRALDWLTGGTLGLFNEPIGDISALTKFITRLENELDAVNAALAETEAQFGTLDPEVIKLQQDIRSVLDEMDRADEAALKFGQDLANIFKAPAAGEGSTLLEVYAQAVENANKAIEEGIPFQNNYVEAISKAQTKVDDMTRTMMLLTEGYNRARMQDMEGIDLIRMRNHHTETMNSLMEVQRSYLEQLSTAQNAYATAVISGNMNMLSTEMQFQMQLEKKRELYAEISSELQNNTGLTDANRSALEALALALGDEINMLDKQGSAYEFIGSVTRDVTAALDENTTQREILLSLQQQLTAQANSETLAGEGLEAQLLAIADALDENAAARRQLLNIPLTFDQELAAANQRLSTMREEAKLNSQLAEQMLAEGATREELVRLGIMEAETKARRTRAKREELSVSEQIAKALGEEQAKYEHLNATLADTSAIEALADKYGTSADRIRRALEETRNGMTDFHNETVTISGLVKNTWDSMSKSMASSITNGIMEGKGAFNSFADFMKDFSKRLISQIIEKMLVQPMIDQMTNMLGLTSKVVPTLAQQFGGMGGGMGGGFNLGGLFGGGGLGGMFSGLWGGISNFASGLWGGISGFFGNLFGGFFADGGYLPAGKVGVVGEAGPELITGPANITPMSGGGEPVVVNFNINAIDTQTGTEFIMKNRKQITGVIQDAYNRRGKQGVY